MSRMMSKAPRGSGGGTPRALRRARWLGWIALAVGATALGCGSEGRDDLVRAAPLPLSAGANPAPVSRVVKKSKPRPAGVVADAATTASGERRVWVMMKQRASLGRGAAADWKGRGQFVHSALTSTAQQSQAALRSWLAARKVKHQAFWAVNTIQVTADAATIAQIAARPDVDRILDGFRMQIPEPVPGKRSQAIEAVEWNVAAVRAPEAWAEFGTRGEGVVVGTIDTGAEFDHPALLAAYRGRQEDGTVTHDYSWHDPSSVCGSPSLAPCDNAGHGTHTMGTIVGDDGGDNQIGVAPGARWITAKGCEDYWCSDTALLSSAQWMLAPTDLNGENPRPELRPQIVSNSWGGGGGDTWYQELVQAWVAAGIFPVFSNGNSGDVCGSSGSPGDYPESYSVGAFDQYGAAAWFSSRGPSYFGDIKPNVAAPGVDVRSSVPGGEYDWYSGTSMAAPHVAGAIALMWSAAPVLAGDVASTRELVDQSARDHEDLSCGGEVGDNNVWGEGELDAWAAVDLSPRGPTGHLAGEVDDEDGAPIVGAWVATTGPANRRIRTDGSGGYALRLPVGSYGVSASAFGYLPLAVTDVAVNEDQTTELPFTLVAAPAFTLDGTVRDVEGGPIVGAEVTVLGTPLPVAMTDETGYFTFGAVPQGTYDVSIDAGGCYRVESVPVTLGADLSLDTDLEYVVDAYGYRCRPLAFDYLPGEDPVGLAGDDAAVTVELPFRFTHYGRTYDAVTIDTNGYLSFTATWSNYYNEPIPSPNEPNAAVFALWDDLWVADPSQILTATVGEAPHRQFVVEWRDVASLYDPALTASFEVVLGEDGDIIIHHASAANDFARGARASAGIENETGDVGLQYSYNRPALRTGLSVLYEVPFAGFAQGVVTDANDLGPVAGAAVTAVNGEGQSRSATTDADGGYRLQLTEGTYVVTVTKANYEVGQATVEVLEDETVIRDFVLATALGSVTPPTVQLLIPVGETRTRTLTLSNDGSLPMDFVVRESGGRRQSVVRRSLAAPPSSADPDARSTAAFLPRPAAGAAAVTPSAAGDVLFSFPTAGLGWAWGIGLGDGLWVSDAERRRNVEFGLDGAESGRAHDAPWSGEWPGDLALDATRNAMCQVAVGGDNGIHCWDQDTGAEVGAITSGEWTSISQRGLAYKATDDTFFVGGWNDGIIYQVQGLGGSSPGAVISTCTPPDWAIAGLAYNDAEDVLWMSTNSYEDLIYELNPYDCTVLATLPPPQSGGYLGAGLEMDPEGNLWAIAQAPNMAYLIDSGVPAFSDVPWLTVAPTGGVVGTGTSASLTVTIDTAGLAPGLYLATIFVQTTSGRQPRLRVPVSVVVSGYVRSVNAGGQAYTDGGGDLWVKPQKYVAGGWGYLQKGTTRTTKRAIAGTADPTLYQSQQEDPYAYRFDGVPDGVYEVDLRFAEIQSGVGYGKRLFDVVVEDELVLPAHDIVYEVGTFAAEQRRFFLPVTDGHVDVRLIPRAGSKKPVINALRVVHRPDR